MLSPEERAEIEKEFPRYPDRKAVAIDAMRIVQRHRGHVSDEAIRDIGGLLGMTPADLDGVATFYSLIYRKPVGRHVVLLCNSVSCWIMGYERLRRQLSGTLGVELGGTTPDGRFTFLPIVCLGTCDHAPAMMVDDDLHRDVTPDGVQRILERYE